MTIDNLAQSSSLDTTDNFIVFECEKGKNKLFISLTGDGGYSCQWQRDGEHGSAVLEPYCGTPKSDRTWIFNCHSSNKDSILNALDSASFFLEFGDRVIITTESPKKTVEKYENKFELWHEHSAVEKHKFDGLNVNCVACELLLSERLATGCDIDFIELVKDCGGMISNAEWSELPSFADAQKGADFPTHALPKDLAEIVETVAEASKVRKGLPATMLLGVLPAIADSYITSDDEQPLSQYSLSLVPTGVGKTTIMSFLRKPFLDWDKEAERLYLEEKQAYEKAKDTDKTAVEPIRPARTFKASTNYSIQGLIIEMLKSNQCIFMDEARSFFTGYAFKNDQKEQTFGFLSSFWSGVPASYQTKDKSFDIRHGATLTLNLAMQHDAFYKVVDESWFASGFLPRFLIHQEPQKQWGAIERIYPISAIKVDQFGDSCYKRYCHTVESRLLRPINDDRTIIINPTIANLLGKIEYKYMAMTDDKYPNCDTYRQHEIYGFICRSRDHVKRISSLMAVYDGISELTAEYVDRAVEIFDYYLSELIRLVKITEDNGENKKMLECIYRLSADSDNKNAPLVSLRQVQSTKIFRSASNSNISIKSAELLEICERLQEFGFLKIKKKGNQTLLKLHPKYRP